MVDTTPTPDEGVGALRGNAPVKKVTRKKVGVKKKMTAATEAPETPELTKADQEIADAMKLVKPIADKGGTEDAMIVALIQKGKLNFQRAGKMLEKCLQQMGVRLDPKARQEQVAKILVKNNFKPQTWEEVSQAVAFIIEHVPATSEKQAHGAIRKFCREAEMDVPKKPKATGPRGGGFRNTIFKWHLENPLATDEEFTAWMKERERSEKLINQWVAIRGHMREWRNAVSEAPKG